MRAEKPKCEKVKTESLKPEAGGQRSEREWETHVTPAPNPAWNGYELELLTQEEAAARLKVTVRTIARFQHDGVVPFLQLGKAVRFYWPAMVAHVLAHCMVVRSLRSATTPLASARQSEILKVLRDGAPHKTKTKNEPPHGASRTGQLRAGEGVCQPTPAGKGPHT